MCKLKSFWNQFWVVFSEHYLCGTICVAAFVKKCYTIVTDEVLFTIIALQTAKFNSIPNQTHFPVIVK